MRVSFAWALATTAPLLGCTAEPTQLVVLVDTDYAVPAEVARIRARVLDAEANEVSSQEFALTNDPSPSDPTLFGVPLSFGVVPIDGDASRRVLVEVDARDVDGTVRVTRRARTGFLPNRTLLLPIFLSRSCEGVVCATGQTCIDGACRDELVSPEGLIVIRPGEELFLDGGLRMDGGVADGPRSPDGSVPLSCSFSECTCDVGYCDVTCVEIGYCAVVCNDLGCTVGAAMSNHIDVTCAAGATCVVDAVEASEAMINCAAGSTCEVDCRSANSCLVRCPDAGTRCLVQCLGSPSCMISECGDAAGVRSCPSGILACGTACP